MYDVIVVGSGLFGSTFAHYAKQINKKVLVLEKSNHIGGNCYTYDDGGINVHKYGPHIFHTSNERVWNFVNLFSKFNHFVLRTKVFRNNKLYSFPINLFTLYQVWGVQTPQEAQKKLEEVKVKIKNPKNLEEWCLSQVGEELYDLFIKHYTAKQWKTDPKNLPSFIIKRLPIRTTFDDNYFTDHRQGIPIGGYTKIFENMLDGVDVQLESNYFENRPSIDKLLKSDGKLIYTGRCDELYNFDKGELQYRNLQFNTTRFEMEDYQGNAVINYCDKEIDFTRITEHKHFEFGKQAHTVISIEKPIDYDRNNTPYYPINIKKNDDLASEYLKRAEADKIIVGGRLGHYRYYDMHQVIASSIHTFEKTYGLKIDESAKM